MSTKMMEYFYSPSNGSGTLQQPVPDSLQVSSNNPLSQYLDASPPSLYSGSSYHHHHSTSKASPYDNKLSELLSFDAFPNDNNGHSTLNLPDLATSPSYSWDDVSFHGDALSSSTAMTTSSGLIDSPFPSVLTPSSSNSYIRPEGNLVNDCLDFNIFDELGVVPSPSSDCSSLFPTLPPTPESATPLSAEEQEIEDIVTSFETDSSPMVLPQVSIHADTPPNPSLIDHTCKQDLAVTNCLQSVSSIAMPTSSSTRYPSTPTHTIESSPIVTKPVKKQPRKKMSATKKKERKKEQNKTAALRYRQKKKEEAQLIDDRQEKLEHKNKKLRDEVHSLENEIQYLKRLWHEVTMARKQMQ